MWTDLSQEEKFHIMRDYVRRGFNNLDAIMQDYDSKEEQAQMPADPISPYNQNPVFKATLDYFRNIYGGEGSPGQDQ